MLKAQIPEAQPTLSGRTMKKSEQKHTEILQARSEEGNTHRGTE
jgi:hypothetical protein